VAPPPFTFQPSYLYTGVDSPGHNRTYPFSLESPRFFDQRQELRESQKDSSRAWCTLERRLQHL